MTNFWDFSVWGSLILVAVLMMGLFIANFLKRVIKPLRNSLIPTSVLGGLILLGIASFYEYKTGMILFDTAVFGGDGISKLEVITYHALALGFIATTLKANSNNHTKERTREIFDTGVTTVSTYLIQALVGMAITMIAARFFMPDLFEVSGILLPLGFGQGTGQALNYGNIYETEFGFIGGKSFGLTIAATGFLSASLGGVIYLNILKRKGKVKGGYQEETEMLRSEDIQSADEIPMNGAMDKLTVQIGIVIISYIVAYGIMYGLGLLLPGMKSTVYGFNFLLGVLSATLIKGILKVFMKIKMVRKQYLNSFMMTRISNFFFDIMVVAGIAAIRLDVLKNYWIIILILSVAGMLVTFFYNRKIAKTLFPKYQEEQFLVMYGMLTGTASTGVVLLREIDSEFRTPASDNIIYQNFPAIVFGFPIMLLVTRAPEYPIEVYLIVIAFFAVMNLILFRSRIFRRKNKKGKGAAASEGETVTAEAAEAAAEPAVEAASVQAE